MVQTIEVRSLCVSILQENRYFINTEIIMCIEDIINGIDQFFMVPEKYSQSNHLTTNYFFEEILDDYNIVKCGNNKSIKQISNFTYKVEFIDFQKNAMKYSVKLIFVPIEDNMCQVSWFELHRIKDDFFKEIPNKMSETDAIEELKSLDSCDDIEERHRIADEILLSVISNYCPNGPEIVDSFISLNKNY